MTTATASLNLTKEQVVDLTKERPALKNVGIGLGWDPAQAGKNIDLDVSAILFDANKKHIDQVFFNEKEKPGIKSLGDNLTGDGDGDDETILVNFEQLSPGVNSIAITVTSYQLHKFNELSNAFVRLYDADTKDEIAKYELKEGDLGPATGMIMALLYRDGADWAVKAIGQPSTVAEAKTFADLVPEATNIAA